MKHRNVLAKKMFTNFTVSLNISVDLKTCIENILASIDNYPFSSHLFFFLFLMNKDYSLCFDLRVRQNVLDV